MSASKFIDSLKLEENAVMTLVSSSCGTVVSAQLALYMVRKRNSTPDSPLRLNLVFGSSMLSKKSRLYMELEKLSANGVIGSIAYDGFQFPGDHVTGMCGKSRVYAIAEALRMAFPLGKYSGHASIFNHDPVSGNLHRVGEASPERVRDYVRQTLVTLALAGPEYRIRAESVLAGR